MADQILQEIKDKLDIVEVISSYVPLKKSGLNFRTVCPFHNEKTPSFNVSPQKQIWHCFGCSLGGDVFGFVMRIENIEFRDALKMLAERAGVELPRYSRESKEQVDAREQFLRINKFAAAFYHKTLVDQKNAEPARVYLNERGLKPATIKQWQIGFAPDDFHSLELALNKKKVLPAHALSAGVLAKNERGQIYDRFRGRITFPIFNYYGDAVGFSARIMPDTKPAAGTSISKSGSGETGYTVSKTAEFKAAKYINSPETPIYSKSKILFGLNFAKEDIRRNNNVVIVEGQMDAISAHQAGFKNTVASSGTALTEEHLNLLGRLTKNLIFCFDADSAGQAAARRVGELALGKGFSVKIVIISGGKDPDEIIRNNPQQWQEQVSQAVWFIDYYLDQASQKFQFDSVEQKKYIRAMIVPLLPRIQDAIELDHYIKKIADRFNIGDSALRGLIKLATAIPAATATVSVYAMRSQLATIEALEKQVIGGMLLYPDFTLSIKQQAVPEDFSVAEIRSLAEALLSAGTVPAELLAATLAKEAQFMVESELELLDANHHALMRELQKAFNMMKVAAIKRRQQRLSAEIKQAEQNKTKTDQLQQEFAALNDERMDYERKL